MTRPYPTLPKPALALSIVLPILLCLVVGGPALASGTPPEPPGTTTPSSPAQSTVELYIRQMINGDRAARGLRPLVIDGRLQDIARSRAGTLADLGVLSHSAAGNMDSELASAGVQWYAWGEDLGWSSSTWGYSAAKALYTMWKGSPDHWALLMSPGYNYYGVGVGYSWSGRDTYASIIISDSRDHTSPTREVKTASRSGSTVHFVWSGADVPLQLHTAGLRSFDVEYRVDAGDWRVIRSGTTTTSVSIANRPGGHVYWVRVRARDKAGNISAWSVARGVTVP
ncbi:MAG TPA: CAP domain-containing protein [Candidatus Binatia bacterium]|nr:CAP domain-containing protein [Candidatus Binatia bacterium]